MGFGNDASFAKVEVRSTLQRLTITAINSTAVTFIAPSLVANASNDFLLTINSVSAGFTVNYSSSATPSLTGVTGDYPTVNGSLMLPATAAAVLNVSGQNFGNDLDKLEVYNYQKPCLLAYSKPSEGLEMESIFMYLGTNSKSLSCLATHSQG